MRNRRRKKVEAKKRRKRTVFFTLGTLVIIYLLLALILGENGLVKYIGLRSVIADIQKEIMEAKKQNEDMKRQIEASKKDPIILEELARKHGLTKEGEIIFKFKDEK